MAAASKLVDFITLRLFAAYFAPIFQRHLPPPARRFLAVFQYSEPHEAAIFASIATYFAPLLAY